jgi:hypothetical protein
LRATEETNAGWTVTYRAGATDISISPDGTIVGRGFNAPISRHDPAGHAADSRILPPQQMGGKWVSWMRDDEAQTRAPNPESRIPDEGPQGLRWAPGI